MIRPEAPGRQVRTALIAGAAGAVGRATAELLLGSGHRCLLVDRDEEAVRSVAAGRDEAPWLYADLTDARAVEHVVAASSARLGGIDSLILAAGIEGPVAPIEETDDSAFDSVMAVNVRSVWLMLKACLPGMKARRRGSVVALSSISGTGPAPLMAAYGASKHAVLGLVRSAAREAAEFGVRVNAVCPGPIDSDMMRRIDRGLSARLPGRLGGAPNAAGSLPLRRYAQADEVARMIAFLCSEESGYCTGGTYMVDGGYTSR